MRWILAMLTLLPAMLSPARPCLAEMALGTAPIDYSLYREGEVRRSETYHGGWLLTCDAIRRLNQKFCSMRSVARSADGTVVGAMTISTDDHGHPAAIVTVPFGMLLAKGVSLSQQSADGRSKSLAVLHPARCGELGCQAVWLINPNIIHRLRNGMSFQLHFLMEEMPPGPLTFASRSLQEKLISGTVMAFGFSDALRASLP